MKISVGKKYRTQCGKLAETSYIDETAPIFKFEGYIFSMGEPVLHTSWNEKGKNIDNKKYNLKTEVKR